MHKNTKVKLISYLDSAKSSSASLLSYMQLLNKSNEQNLLKLLLKIAYWPHKLIYGLMLGL